MCRALSLLSQLISARADPTSASQPPTAPNDDSTTAPAADEPQPAAIEEGATKQTLSAHSSNAAAHQRVSVEHVDSIAPPAAVEPPISGADGARTVPVTDETAVASPPVAVNARRRTTVASVHLPCVTPTTSRSLSSPAAALSSVSRLLSDIDFRAVTERATESSLSLSAVAPSSAATTLFAYFRQQAHTASQWRKQQTAPWTDTQRADDRHSRSSNKSRGDKHYDDMDRLSGGEESKQQLTIASHRPAEREQMVKPITLRSAVRHSQRDRTSKRGAQKKGRQQSKLQ